MILENNLNREDWDNLIDELSEVNDEYVRIGHKGRNDFKYYTEFVANTNRKNEIISRSVELIQGNSELNHIVLRENPEFKSEQELKDHLEHMEARGFWIEANYRSYMTCIFRYLEKKFD
jgi:hypothetical protein